MANQFTKGARFYVYKIISASGSIQYIGKGSGKRLQQQAKRFGRKGLEIARFWSESDAYAFEAEMIAEHRPPLNQVAGRGGPKHVPRARKDRRTKDELEMERLGMRVYVARFLVSRDLTGYLDPSKVEEIRRVAYG